MSGIGYQQGENRPLFYHPSPDMGVNALSQQHFTPQPDPSVSYHGPNPMDLQNFPQDKVLVSDPTATPPIVLTSSFIPRQENHLQLDVPDSTNPRFFSTGSGNTIPSRNPDILCPAPTEMYTTGADAPLSQNQPLYSNFPMQQPYPIIDQQLKACPPSGAAQHISSTTPMQVHSTVPAVNTNRQYTDLSHASPGADHGMMWQHSAAPMHTPIGTTPLYIDPAATGTELAHPLFHHPSQALPTRATFFGSNMGAGRAADVSQLPYPGPEASGIPVRESPGISRDTLSAVLSANAYQEERKNAQKNQEEQDREQLEKIIRLRRELEMEEEQEKENELEHSTWSCPACTYRNPLPVTNCHMCDTANPRNPLGPASEKSTDKTGWNCPQCFTLNKGNVPCVVCGSSKEKKASNQPLAAPLPGSRGAKQSTHSHWRCSVCNKINPVGRLNCEACSSYQRNGIPVQDTDTKNLNPLPKAQKPHTPEVESSNTWTCSVCTLNNEISVAVCQACESGQRPRHLSPAVGYPIQTPQSRETTNFNSQKPKLGRTKVNSSLEPSSASTWNCPICTFINSSGRSKCDMCGTPAPGSLGKKDDKRKTQEDVSDAEEEVLWQEDHVAKICNRCKSEFSLMRRRHHCRACGFVFCATCSPFYAPLKKDGPPVRMCANCHEARGSKK